MTITPAAFIQKWKKSTLGEDKHGKGSVLHFLDLCDLLGVEKPSDKDLDGSRFCFEKGVSKATGAKGWADVWKRGCFAWEYKGKGKDLNKAHDQLLHYAAALENPPLLIVSDMLQIVVRTNWTNTVSETHVFEIDDLLLPDKREKLWNCFEHPEKLKPSKSTQALTDEAAKTFAELAFQMRGRGHAPEAVAHFINRVAFCMFAEDVDLLPKEFFTERLYKLVNHPERAEMALKSLFGAMSKGGMYGDDLIPWFNGGLFDDDGTLPLTPEDLGLLYEASKMDWQDIDPSIFGTLFERGLDPKKRSQLGAHYTDAEKIEMIVDPVVRQPLFREWAAVKSKIEKAKTPAARQKLQTPFLERLKNFRVLDPACGSGNFLYLALKELKDLEHRVHLECENLGINRPLFMVTGPHNMMGIELNSYAAELARMTVWIGEIQWCLKNGQQIDRKPILKPLQTIKNHDALLEESGKEFHWPKTNVIIGNPPFLGSRKMQPELGGDYVSRLRKTYGKRVSDGADFVCFWFQKAHEAMVAGNLERAGFVATNSISGGENIGVLKNIAEKNEIYSAWDDEPWTVEGADVRVALICFAPKGQEAAMSLNGSEADEIYPDLTARTQAGGVNVTDAKIISSNAGIAFQGVVPRSNVNPKKAKELGLPHASFVIGGSKAREMLLLPSNPNGRLNTDVVRAYRVAEDITTRPLDRFIVDFDEMPEMNSQLYEAPYAYIQGVKAHRAAMEQEDALEYWWQHWRSRPELKKKLVGLERYIATGRVSKHRIFVWFDASILPDNAVVAVVRDDDVTFGILQSRFHEVWALRKGTFLGVGNDPRYTPSTTFETFPFPKGLEPNLPVSGYNNPHAGDIAKAAQNLNQLRENWLNPPELVKRVKEVVSGYPDRILPKDDAAQKELKKRTLTKLYNAKFPWLMSAHAALDAAVSAAYGWPTNLSDDDILKNLLALNRKATKTP